jgi:hypothetical protein
MRNTTGDDGFTRVPRRSGEAGLYGVPRWEELVADPSQAEVLDVRTARIVATKALTVFVACLYRSLEGGDGPGIEACRMSLCSNGPANSSSPVPPLDDILSVEEVASILRKPRRWVIRHAARLPFVIRISRKHFICSKLALRRWLAARPGILRR